MNNVNEIVFAIDINDIQIEQVKYIYDYACQQSASLHLVNFVKRSPQVGYGYVSTTSFDEENIANAKLVFEHITNDFPTLNTDVILGNPKEQVLDYLKNKSADLLVLQGHHHWGLGVMGSFATFCVQNSPCNVLVLRNAQNK